MDLLLVKIFLWLSSTCTLTMVQTQTPTVKFLLVREENQENFVTWFEDALRELDSLPNLLKHDLHVITSDDENNTLDKVCHGFSLGCNAIADVTWTGSKEVQSIADDLNAPYVRIDLSIGPVLHLLDKYLDQRNSSDLALIFDDPKWVDEALYFWLDTIRMRMVLTDTLDKTSAKRLRNLRPMANNYAIVASTVNMSSLFNLAKEENLVQIPERWNLVFLDLNRRKIFPQLQNNPDVNLISLDRKICCSLLDTPNCLCPDDFIPQKYFLLHVIKMLSKILQTLNVPPDLQCNTTTLGDTASTSNAFKNLLETELAKSKNVYRSHGALRFKVRGLIEVVANTTEIEKVATFTEDDGVVIEKGKRIGPVKAFYRVGVTHAIPWAYKQTNPATGETSWTGYCMDFVQKLSEVMDFDYELVEPVNGTFGERDKMGNWDGIVGDLQRGETDLAISAMTMTADREEVIDFVAPYFEQSGISIVMRKPVRKTSLFKFMTVLKLEVWLSIVGALIVTGFMIWFLDKYSPYSARNNKKAYPYPCRQFSLKESFWFALTSFTPQGGGEAPKALSSRTLVAAYWLFVVLMLATFTANLAAFLTVERMQTPVQSLEQLAKQSRINYTVVEGSEVHQYFINMKNAEDTLYRMWKELTLNASTDETQYRVWDYPIREQYGHILLAINDSMPVANAAEGFRKVNEYLDADFAFIHDSSEIKYEISRNCNLTEVGEVFAEKLYAVALQQGSHLQDEISKRILDLQKDRFFDYLQSKYWNHSLKGVCPNSDDNEGITLESLGGVFIATLFGLALAMITLAGEVIYYRRKRMKNEGGKLKVDKKKGKSEIKFVKPGPETITIGSTFKPVAADKNKPNLSPFVLYPRSRNRVSHLNLNK